MTNMPGSKSQEWDKVWIGVLTELELTSTRVSVPVWVFTLYQMNV